MATYRALVVGELEQSLERDGAVHVHGRQVDDNGEHMTGVAELGHRAAAGHVERPLRLHRVHVYDAENHPADGRHERVQPGRVQRHVRHVLRVVHRQQHRTALVVPQLNGPVQLAGRREQRFPGAHGQAGHAAVV